jgi:hypothetical protein
MAGWQQAAAYDSSLDMPRIRPIGRRSNVKEKLDHCDQDPLYAVFVFLQRNVIIELRRQKLRKKRDINWPKKIFVRPKGVAVAQLPPPLNTSL